jgi:hypothetical protein
LQDKNEIVKKRQKEKVLQTEKRDFISIFLGVNEILVLSLAG